MIAIYFVIRQVEDQVVMPQVIGRAVHLHPVVTIFAVLVGVSAVRDPRWTARRPGRGRDQRRVPRVLRPAGGARQTRTAAAAAGARTGGRLMLESLDYVYVPSRDVATDLAAFEAGLGGRVVFAIEAMGTRSR